MKLKDCTDTYLHAYASDLEKRIQVKHDSDRDHTIESFFLHMAKRELHNRGLIKYEPTF